MNGDPYERARQALAEDLRSRGIRDERVLAAMSRVPRHVFCPEEDREHAYEDEVIQLTASSTLSQPYVVAAMLEGLELVGGERALDVGSGSGYTSALLCELCGMVYGVELDGSLVAASVRRLRDLGYRNVTLRQGDGWEGWLDHAPYDGILVSAAVPAVPPALLDQLAVGGRLVAPVGGEASQMLRAFWSAPDGTELVARDVFPVRFVPLVRGPGAGES